MYTSDMPYDVDGNWQGFEPPLCPDCLDVPMEETERGYRCSFCSYRTEWDEESGKWINYPMNDITPQMLNMAFDRAEQETANWFDGHTCSMTNREGQDECPICFFRRRVKSILGIEVVLPDNHPVED